MPRSSARSAGVLLGCAAVAALTAMAVVPGTRAEDATAHFGLAAALHALRAGHPLLKAAEYGIAAAQADVRDAKLWTNPSASIQYTPGVRASSYDRAGYLSYGVTQFLELRNAPGARAQAAQHEVLATQAERQGLLLSLSLAVEAALIDVVSAERKVELVAHALTLLDAASAVVHKRFEAGASPRYDTTRIGVTLATAHADLDEAEATRARAWAELGAAVGPGMAGLHGSADYPLETALPLPEAPALLALLEQKRPDLDAARQRKRAAEAQITAAKRSVWSGVGLSALGGFGAAPRQIDVGVGLSAALPVVDRGQGAVPAAEQRALQAEAYQAGVLLPAAQRLAGMREEVIARQRALEDYGKRAVVSGDEMLEEAQAGYLAGRFSVLELADAYGAWRESRLRAIDLAAAARNAELDLEREIGVQLRAQ